ncbi:hypothetical protein AAG570_000331 [Ranatra chinensis]|uniref:Transposase Helix-turn-helix domain-containing protein n=1 Tax=Ranatra chinensis TaxID=642074 RepID=A0ABD0ZK20_9HEMI
MWNNMSRQRKQTLSIRDYNDLEIVDMSQEQVNPVLQPSTPIKTSEYSPVIQKTPENKHDPFMHQIVGDSPTGLSLETSLGGYTGGAVSPIDMSTEELVNSHFTTFMDVLPDDDPWGLAGLDRSPSADSHSDNIARELFQDLKHTSTPKGVRTSVSLSLDSGIQLSNLSLPSRKRIKFNKEIEPPTSGRVLHDITGNNSALHKSVDSFTNISVDSDSSCTDCGSENKADQDRIKRVSIIRRNLVKKSVKSPLSLLNFDTSLEVPLESGMNHSVTLQQKKVLYYTGIKDYNKAVSLLMSCALSTEGLTSSQVVLMTLMRLRLNLEWQDLSFRFNAREDTVIRLFEKTLDSLASTLADNIPWKGWQNDQRLKNDTRPRLIYIHPVYFKSDSLQKILVCVSSGRVPVVYISKACSSEQKVFDVVISKFGCHLATDDVLCSCEHGKDDIVCFKVERSSPEHPICLSYKDSNMFWRLDAIFSLELLRVISTTGSMGHYYPQSLKLKKASKRRIMFYQNKKKGTTEVGVLYPQSLKLKMASKRRNMFYENKKQETT